MLYTEYLTKHICLIERKNSIYIVIICNQTNWNLIKKVMFVPPVNAAKFCGLVFLCYVDVHPRRVLLLYG